MSTVCQRLRRIRPPTDPDERHPDAVERARDQDTRLREPIRPHVDHPTHNPKVAGSNPAPATQEHAGQARSPGPGLMLFPPDLYSTGLAKSRRRASTRQPEESVTVRDKWVRGAKPAGPCRAPWRSRRAGSLRGVVEVGVDGAHSARYYCICPRSGVPAHVLDVAAVGVNVRVGERDRHRWWAHAISTGWSAT
jgi:hypothetical protein